jgi:hypothetical protein
MGRPHVRRAVFAREPGIVLATPALPKAHPPHRSNLRLGSRPQVVRRREPAQLGRQ